MFKVEKREFSKWLLVQESALIWILSILFILLAFYCVALGYMGSLPWITAMVSLPWTSYGVSQCFYYKKSGCENKSGGIKFETAMLEKMNTMAMQTSTEEGCPTI